MAIRGEHDGTGKPNFARFKAEYDAKPDLSFSAIQFHREKIAEEHFGEYFKILEFLLSEGWRFVLPREFGLLQVGDKK